MTRRERLAALWVVLHLLLVLLGALELLPLPRRPGSPWHWLAAYTEYTGAGNAPARHTEPLAFENVKLATRSYK